MSACLSACLPAAAGWLAVWLSGCLAVWLAGRQSVGLSVGLSVCLCLYVGMYVHMYICICIYADAYPTTDTCVHKLTFITRIPAPLDCSAPGRRSRKSPGASSWGRLYVRVLQIKRCAKLFRGFSEGLVCGTPN